MKRSMRLTRIPDLFVPAALLGASVLGQPEIASLFYICFLAVSLLSLFTAQGLRISFAAQPSLRSVRGSVKLALLLQVLALPAALLIAHLTGLLRISALWACLCAGCLFNIEHTFYEYLDAVGDGHGAALCEGLSALLLLTGLCLTGGVGDFAQPAWLTGLSGLAALIAAIAALSSGAFSKGRLNARVLAASPRAAIQSLLYPAAFAATLMLPFRCGASIAFFSGLTVCSLCRTPFRRSPSETSPLNRGLALTCSICAALSAVSHWAGFPKAVPGANIYAGFSLPYACLAVAISVVCAFALYGNLRRAER